VTGTANTASASTINTGSASNGARTEFTMSKSQTTIEPKIAHVHPGEVLQDILSEAGLSAHAASLAMGIPANRLAAIIKGQRGISPGTALRLGRYLGGSAEMWINMQAGYESPAGQEASRQENQGRSAASQS
jgi:addiction module HigA family antidote